MADLSVGIGALRLRSPVVLASGTWGYDEPLWREDLMTSVGAVCSKAITELPRDGNPGTRIWETPCGLLNSIGLQNTGIDDFVDRVIPLLKDRGTPLVANVSMEDEAGLNRMVERLLPLASDVSAIELNVSCPNVDHGCMSWGVSPDLTARATAMVRELWSGPLWVKMTPQAPNPGDVARSAQDSGADALVVANTWLGMAVDVQNRRPVFQRAVAGLSGPAVFPLALRLVWQVAGAVSIPVIGCGGVSSGENLLAMVMVGATAVEVGTGLFGDLHLPERILEQVASYMDEEGVTDLADLIGIAR
ncbi:MAG: dihydroorotate dehydrogenase B catalytic subunit [Dethiosulfovibrio peptidovorans]|nr:MAG: dihydroorotate dehydrogenase B catalytic subunit [Dethiosulfovibrio peptidovorans]